MTYMELCNRLHERFRLYMRWPADVLSGVVPPDTWHDPLIRGALRTLGFEERVYSTVSPNPGFEVFKRLASGIITTMACRAYKGFNLENVWVEKASRDRELVSLLDEVLLMGDVPAHLYIVAIRPDWYDATGLRECAQMIGASFSYTTHLHARVYRMRDVVRGILGSTLEDTGVVSELVSQMTLAVVCGVSDAAGGLVKVVPDLLDLLWKRVELGFSTVFVMPMSVEAFDLLTRAAVVYHPKCNFVETFEALDRGLFMQALFDGTALGTIKKWIMEMRDPAVRVLTLPLLPHLTYSKQRLDAARVFGMDEVDREYARILGLTP